MDIELPNGWSPRRYQFPAWDYLQRGGRHAELVWHRRAGKDELALHWAAVAAFTRVGNYWHCLPKATQARKALWEAVNPHTGKRRIHEAFPVALQAPVGGVNDAEMRLRFVNGSTWQVIGSDNFDTLVGSPPIGITFSEWPICNPAAWAYLRPIFAENNGWVLFNGTPRGKNHAYRSFNGARRERESFAQILPVSETGVFTQDQLAKERRELINDYGEEYGQSIYEQEYNCSFEAANIGAILGRALVRAEQEGRISDDVIFDPDGAPIEISCDIGRRDATSVWFWQPCVGGFRIVDYDKDSGLDADEWCVRINERLAGRKLGCIWLPHDARAKTFAAKHTAVDIFMSRFGATRVDVTPDASKTDRINAARRVIQRCSFNETLTEKGRDGLAAWSYVYDEERKEFSKEPDHNWASHDGDGFSYGALVMEEREPIKEPEVKPIVGLGVGYPSVSLNDLWNTVPKQNGRI